jgi:hypothetical protein
MSLGCGFLLLEQDSKSLPQGPKVTTLALFTIHSQHEQAKLAQVH